MIRLNTAQTKQVVVDTVRLSYVELSFDEPHIAAILSYGSTDNGGVFTLVRKERIDIDASGKTGGLVIDTTALAQVLSDARNAIEAFLQGDTVTVPAGAQISEAVPVVAAIVEAIA